tara:strand:- start:4930 stop:7509 length:2580 start_codon:yes stop_codon:yes gene_type:complete
MSNVSEKELEFAKLIAKLKQGTLETQEKFLETVEAANIAGMGAIENHKREADEIRKKIQTQAFANKTVEMMYKKRLFLLNQEINAHNDIDEKLAQQETQNNKIVKNYTKIHGKVKQISSGWKQIISSLVEVNNIAKDINFGIDLKYAQTMAGYFKTFAAVRSEMMSLTEGKKAIYEIDALGKSINRTTFSNHDFRMGIKNTQKDLRGYGVTSKEVAETYNLLYKNVTDFSKQDKVLQFQLRDSALRFQTLNISTQDTAKAMEVSTKTFGMSFEEQENLQVALALSAKAMQIAPEQMLQNYVRIAPRLASYGKKMEQVFIGLAAKAKASGASIDELFKVAEGFDQFESAARITGKLNAMFGTQLNSVQLMMADESERLDIIREHFKMMGKPVTGRWERKSLARILGTDVGTVVKLFSEAAGGAEDLELATRKATSITDRDKDSFYNDLTQNVDALKENASIWESIRNMWVSDDTLKGVEDMNRVLSDNRGLYKNLEDAFAGANGFRSSLTAAFRDANQAIRDGKLLEVLDKLSKLQIKKEDWVTIDAEVERRASQAKLPSRVLDTIGGFFGGMGQIFLALNARTLFNKFMGKLPGGAPPPMAPSGLNVAPLGAGVSGPLLPGQTRGPASPPLAPVSPVGPAGRPRPSPRRLRPVGPARGPAVPPTVAPPPTTTPPVVPPTPSPIRTARLARVRAGAMGGAGAGALMGVMGAYQTYTDVRRQQQTTAQKTAAAIGRGVGTGTGFMAGGAIGGAFGGIPGFIIGGLLGMVLGQVGGTVGESVADTITDAQTQESSTATEQQRVETRNVEQNTDILKTINDAAIERNRTLIRMERLLQEIRNKSSGGALRTLAPPPESGLLPE